MAAKALVVVGVGAASTWLWLLVMMTVGGLAGQQAVDRWIGWCPKLYLADGHVPLWQGIVGSALLALAAAGLMRAAWAQLQLRRSLPRCGETGVLLVDSMAPSAFTVPGRHGGVVVSRGMVAALDEDERRVLWAHEGAHLRNHHHRFLAVADLAAGVCPLLRPAARQVDFAIERWADEDSAECTGDRRLVARAIAKAALASIGQRDIRLAMSGSSVPARVEAMLSTPRTSGPAASAGVLSLVALAATAVGGSTIQLHHLLSLAQHVCGGA